MKKKPVQPPIVFVVDDDPSVRRSLARLITSVGLRVESFESADSFLARLPCHGIGCLILDVRMPVVDGLELQDRLAHAAPHLPIIFVTGHGDTKTREKVKAKGALDLLLKPFHDEELLAAIGTALAKSRATFAAPPGNARRRS